MLHCLGDLLTCQLIPGGGDDGGAVIQLTEQFHALMKLFILDVVRAGEHDAVGVFHLIIEEFAEILHIHLTLVCIYDGGIAVEHQIVGVDILNCLDDVGELAYAGGLDEDAVRRVFRQDFFQRFAEVAYETAADTAGVHFRYFDACILQKTAVDADFAEFVFDKNQLFSAESFGDEFFDECGFACAQETRENIDLCHFLL